MSLKEYQPGTRFPGVIGRTVETSTPAWPKQVRPNKGAPNVLFVVLDDTGYGQLGCFGSPIKTPHIDALAADGLRYTNMHATALCSPSRSCLLTGRNHHSNHMACISNGNTGYPGADGYIPFENGFLSEILLQQGYATYCLGKWHLAPEETMSAAGPFDRWPLGRGFERFYGFLGGDTHQYYPELVRDNTQTEPERSPEEGYHLSEDLVEKAKGMIADTKQVAPDKPFFLYLAFGAMHAPHHVRKEWSDNYRGAFNRGWDHYREQTFEKQKALGILPANTKLSIRDPDVPDWETLSETERKVYARMMEVFAGFLTHTDHCIGELIQFLKDIGEYDNTLVVLVSDNGSSAEGGPGGSLNECRFFNNVPDKLEESLNVLDEIGGPKFFNHFPWGWAHAGNTPFRRWKRETYRGGASDPLIISWPERIKAHGETRAQYAHLIDLLPTVLDALSIEPPQAIRGITQAPIEGVSMVCTFDDARAPSQHVTQYFEMMGHRAIYHDGYRAVCPWPGASFQESGRKFGTPITDEMLTELDATGWELFDVSLDVSETNNIADQERPRLLSMISMWYAEAGKYNVLPIDSRGVQRLADERPQVAPPRQRYVLYPGTQAVPAGAGPRILNRPFTITAEVEIPTEGADGVLLSMGGSDGGLAFYIQEGILTYVHNYLAIDHSYTRARRRLPEGHHFLSMEFEPTGAPDVAHGKGVSGNVTLFVDGEKVGEGEIPVTAPFRLGQGAAMLVGADAGAAVTPEYRAPFRFRGKIKRIIVDVSGEHVADYEAEMRVALAKD
jgi:arylsulfatase A-like enzyme